MTKTISRAELSAEYRSMVESVADAPSKELDEIYASLSEIGVTIAGWSRMRVEAKREALIALVPPPKQKGQTKQATMPKDPKWRRRTMKAWQIPFASARRCARRASA